MRISRSQKALEAGCVLAHKTDYHCTVNAVDGSILEAYRIEVSPDGDGGYSFESVYYEH